MIERFTASAPGLSGSARRTLRTNLRFIARQVVPHLDPADTPLPRGRAKAPYTPGEIAGYLALADAQPTPGRQARAVGLVCLGAGAGLIRGDLRNVRGTDVTARPGGVIVAVTGGRAPRAVPVLARYHARLLAAAAFAGENFLTGGTEPERGNITNPLTRSLAGGGGLPPWTPPGCAPPGWPTAPRPSAWRRSCAPPGSPAASTSATSPPAWNPAARPAPSPCSAAGPGNPVSVPLAVIEDIIDASGTALLIEDLLPVGARARQLGTRTLLTGMMLALADGRPAHLTRVRQALTGLSQADQERLGVIAEWKTGPHQLTYRQVEHTFRLITRALSKNQPDGAPSGQLQRACDQLLEASIPAEFKTASTSLAADWTDVEARARPVRHDRQAPALTPRPDGVTATSTSRSPEARCSIGYYFSAATMVADENGPAVPELTRRITLASTAHDPAAALAGVLTSMPASGIPLGDVLADSGYSHRVPDTWASPLRAAGASSSRTCTPQTGGPSGTHQGTIICQRQPVLPADSGGAVAAGPPAARRQRLPTWLPTTSKPPSWPGTNSACTPPMTPTATAATPAPPPPGRSAARSARSR